LKYSFDQRKIRIDFETYEDLVKANGTHGLSIKLIDKGFEEKSYAIALTFFKKGEKKVEKKVEKVFIPEKEEEKPPPDLYAKIVKLNQYGNMRIRFS
jgi:hypothetical protein